MSSSRVILPKLLTGPNEQLNNEWRVMRNALLALKYQVENIPRPAGGSNAHPFKVTVADAGSDWTATVGAGKCYVLELTGDTASDSVWSAGASIDVASADVTALTDNNTWGIFAEFTRSGKTTGVNDVPATGTTQEGWGVLAFSQFVKDSSQTAGGLAGAATGKHYFHIADVDINSGVVTITQYIKDNIWAPDIHNTVDTDT